MDEIEFDAPFGDEVKRVKISNPIGAGHGQYYLSVDGWHYGVLVKYEDEWVLHSNTKPLTTDDIDTEYTKYKAIFNELKKKDFSPEDVFKEQKVLSPFFKENALLYLKGLKPHARYSASSRLEKILRYTGKDFRIDTITSGWFDGFRTHCRTNEKNIKGEIGNSENTINYAFRFVGRVASYAGVKIPLPKIKFTRTLKEKLTSSELIAFNNVECSGVRLLAKNTFMLQYYFRGMRIGDLLKLERSMIKGDRLIYDTSKSNYQHSIKIVEPAKHIIDMYEGKYVLPWIKGDLDEDALATEVKSKTALINRELKAIAKDAKPGIQKNISTHIARHSFASISDKMLGGDLKAIQGMMGHTRRKQTEDYIEELRRSDELDDAADKVFG